MWFSSPALIFLLTLIFVPLERVFAARAWRGFQKGWLTDLLFFVGQTYLWTFPVVLVLGAVADLISQLPLDGLQKGLAGHHPVIQVIVALLTSDLCTYWGHRLSHRLPWLWRFHRVHHTSKHLDWLAAYREHPLDNLYTRLIENVPLLVLGIPWHFIAGLAAFRGLWAVFIHSNVELHVGPLAYVLGAPRLHHWHHDESRGRTDNFANLNPLMDLVFGTYFDPGKMPETVGFSGEKDKGFVALILRPFR